MDRLRSLLTKLCVVINPLHAFEQKPDDEVYNTSVQDEHVLQYNYTNLIIANLDDNCGTTIDDNGVHGAV